MRQAVKERYLHIQAASRIEQLPPYLFARINKLTYDKRRGGCDVIDMSMGNPSDPPAQFIIDKLAEAANDTRNHGYAPASGVVSLRREVASRYLRKWGVRLDPETEVLGTLGSKEGFGHLCLAMLNPGDDVIVPAPSYPAHVYAVALASGNPIAIDTTNPDKFLSEVSSRCESEHGPPKVLVVNFPHNPTTTVVEKDFYEDVVAVAKRYEFPIISDLAYSDVVFDGYETPSILSVEGAKQLAVEFTTMSKGYSMAGWRVGFCAGNAEIIKALGTVKTYYDYGMFRPIQIAAIVALRNGEVDVANQSQIYQRRRDVLCDGLGRIGWQVTVPKASMFVWAKIPEPFASQMNSMDFSAKLLEEADVAVSPGAGFGPAGEGYLRMALIENENRIRQAVKQIGRAIGSELRALTNEH
ncbi:MAG: aminotransferase class I/II-fold pyridoxal phosphate-dependent enzyme [Planctomycetaceae bacterium]|nr:aminotransferase class I/II-fold pyridoxal phosphate-dependent enzyme [Planctomycetaceae bacterium]MBT4886221.1 aminotransferase class I/II-fold pyridoxal phosphate-dependent enzyme [Planctomycetaceae bacterium]MBT6459471.1 aminotransferase class I/II-fold pyridoxal phosphate-dependent enzyme [Planctomycetaceae bacterium]MBT7727461.1 aminotransferase class I/II-fold pyridoxal phosphate-dependent enzyme [Planctomycetaceae bacterium]